MKLPGKVEEETAGCCVCVIDTRMCLIHGMEYIYIVCHTLFNLEEYHDAASQELYLSFETTQTDPAGTDTRVE